MQKEPIQINLSFDANVRKHVAVVPTGWSGKKNEEQALATIGELLDKEKKPFVPSEALRELITAMFNSERTTKMALLKDKLEAEGADVDPTSEGFLDLLCDEPQFRIFLANIKDPKTGATLVEKKHRPNRKKLLQAAFGAQALEAAAPASPAPAAVDGITDQGGNNTAPVQPEQVNSTAANPAR